MGKSHWDDIYRDRSLDEIPWQSSQPDKILVKLIKEKKVEKGKDSIHKEPPSGNKRYLYAVFMENRD